MSRYPEFTTDEIREGRKKYRNDLLQPYREGEFSKEFRDAHFQQSMDMVRDGVITEHQFNHAKDVWMGDELR